MFRDIISAPIDGDYYWLNAPGIDPQSPLMIGRYIMRSADFNQWRIDGQVYTAGTGIDAVKRIPKPRV